MKLLRLIPLFTFLLLLAACGGETSEAAEEMEGTSEEEAPMASNWSPPAVDSIAFTTETPGVMGEALTYGTDSATLEGYISVDTTLDGKRPGVLVIHEWWGHNQYARDRADMLAGLGYVALAVDMYGEGKLAEHPEDAGKFSGAVFANMDAAKARFTAAMEELKKHPNVDPEKIAAIGYCFGGSVALTMANAGYDLDAVAAFHSGVQLPVMPAADGEYGTRVLVANGTADPFISVESVAGWTKAMEAAGADFRYMALDDAKHAYSDPGATEKGKAFGLPLEYNEAADRASWSAMQELFNKVF